jgi:hypothetical protein
MYGCYNFLKRAHIIILYIQLSILQKLSQPNCNEHWCNTFNATRFPKWIGMTTEKKNSSIIMTFGRLSNNNIHWSMVCVCVCVCVSVCIVALFRFGNAWSWSFFPPYLVSSFEKLVHICWIFPFVSGDSALNPWSDRRLFIKCHHLVSDHYYGWLAYQKQSIPIAGPLGRHRIIIIMDVFTISTWILHC